MNPAFRFARGGKVFKELEADEADEIQGLIRTGVISSNDDYWTPGMNDWKKVYTRQWEVPAPTPKPVPAAVPLPRTTPPTANTVAATSAGITAAAGQAGGVFSYECPSCKKGFNNPAKSVSGYSVIRLAILDFIISLVLIGISIAVYTKWTVPAIFGDSRASYVASQIISGLLSLAGLVFLLMSLFELIASAVTHGIYRAHPDCCPHCKSPHYVRKG